MIDNNNGTAPGIIIEKDGKSVILLPGPPNELIPMFKNVQDSAVVSDRSCLPKSFTTAFSHGSSTVTIELTSTGGSPPVLTWARNLR